MTVVLRLPAKSSMSTILFALFLVHPVYRGFTRTFPVVPSYMKNRVCCGLLDESHEIRDLVGLRLGSLRSSPKLSTLICRVNFNKWTNVLPIDIVKIDRASRAKLGPTCEKREKHLILSSLSNRKKWEKH